MTHWLEIFLDFLAGLFPGENFWRFFLCLTAGLIGALLIQLAEQWMQTTLQVVLVVGMALVGFFWELRHRQKSAAFVTAKGLERARLGGAALKT